MFQHLTASCVFSGWRRLVFSGKKKDLCSFQVIFDRYTALTFRPGAISWRGRKDENIASLTELKERSSEDSWAQKLGKIRAVRAARLFVIIQPIILLIKCVNVVPLLLSSLLIKKILMPWAQSPSTNLSVILSLSVQTQSPCKACSHSKTQTNKKRWCATRHG